MAKYSLIRKLDELKKPIGLIDVVGGAVMSLRHNRDRLCSDLDIYGDFDKEKIKVITPNIDSFGFIHNRKGMLEGWKDRREIIYENDFIKVRGISKQDMITTKFKVYEDKKMFIERFPMDEFEKHMRDFFSLNPDFDFIKDSLEELAQNKYGLNYEKGYDSYKESLNTIWKFRKLWT